MFSLEVPNVEVVFVERDRSLRILGTPLLFGRTAGSHALSNRSPTATAPRSVHALVHFPQLTLSGSTYRIEETTHSG